MTVPMIDQIRAWRDSTRDRLQVDKPSTNAEAWWRDVDALLVALDAATDRADTPASTSHSGSSGEQS